MRDDQEQGGLFDRWRARLAHTLLREPSVVLIDRDADLSLRAPERDGAFVSACEKPR